MSKKQKVVLWPDGTTCPLEDFDYEQDWSWMSDDYEIVDLEIDDEK
jgi:hypothetical protein